MLLLLLATCGYLTAQSFVESSEEAGLTHIIRPLTRISTGLAIFDFDNDGDDDVYVVGGQTEDALFRNDGNGNFENVSEEFGIVEATFGITTQSVVTADIDNDGIREIMLGTFVIAGASTDRVPNLLLRLNEATGKYENIAPAAGLIDTMWTTNATFFDADLDGNLDLYVSDYIDEIGFTRDSMNMLSGFDHDCGENRFFFGNGDGTFTPNDELFGPGNQGCTLAGMATDTDNDGDQDLIVINDFGQWIEPDALYRNDLQDGLFTDDDQTSSFRNMHYGMGIAAGDVNEDLLMDYYITNIGRNAFMLNQGNNVFTRAEASYRITDEFTNFGNFTTGWGTFFADLNNDTYLDLFVANGFVASALDVDDSRQSDKVFRGLPQERFFDATPSSGITDTMTTRGAVYADLDNNGLLDILVVVIGNGPEPDDIRYYRNVTSNAGGYVAFRLSSDEGNRDAFGSKVTVYAGGRAFLREHVCGGSHASQNSSLLHFGLGDITAVDSVSIRWPDGRVGWMYEPEINRVHTIERGDLLSSVQSQWQRPSFSISPNPATNQLMVTGTSYAGPYQVIDLNGRRVAEGELSPFNKLVLLPELTPGMYLLRLGRGTAKFIVR